MHYTVYFTNSVLFELDEIEEYIARDSPIRAISFVEELQQRMRDTLSTIPNSGRIYKQSTRFIALSGYVVLCEVEETTRHVHVLHIVSGRTDWKA